VDDALAGQEALPAAPVTLLQVIDFQRVTDGAAHRTQESRLADGPIFDG
jgi:hypothetical protein